MFSARLRSFVMILRVRRVIFALTAVLTLLSVDLTYGAIVPWDVDAAQSFVRLAIPDQTVVLDGTSTIVRLRGANNAAWSDSNGARAALDGTIWSDIQSNSIDFLGGAHSLVALETGSYRPNPAEWNPSATNADNPDGQYGGTGGAPAAFAAKARSTVSLLNLDLFYLALRDVLFDLDSGLIPLVWNGNSATIAEGTSTFGIQSAAVDIDGIAVQIVGQIVPDILHAPLTDQLATNIAGGCIELYTPSNPFGQTLTLNINVPLTIDVEGVPLQATINGRVVATIVPEPSSVLLAGFAICGLGWAGRRRLHCRCDGCMAKMGE
jgi:hypothetical protein